MKVELKEAEQLKMKKKLKLLKLDSRLSFLSSAIVLRYISLSLSVSSLLSREFDEDGMKDQKVNLSFSSLSFLFSSSFESKRNLLHDTEFP